MTEPTDGELDAVLCNQWPAFSMQDTLVRVWVRAAMRDALAKWGTPPAVAKWAREEISDGHRGIRWVTEVGIHGRPTDHDVREYLKRTPTAHGCHCDECKQFYTTPQPTQAQAGAVPLTDEQTESLLWKYGYDPDDEHMAAMLKEAHGIKGGQLPGNCEGPDFA